MKKKKQTGIAKDTLNLTKGLVLSGTGLTLGSAFVAKLPSTPASAGIQKGFATAGNFMAPIASIGAAGIVFKQVRKINMKKKKGYKL